eukprot:7469805-Alexandrium_andersonii.AAC.1
MAPFCVRAGWVMVPTVSGGGCAGKSSAVGEELEAGGGGGEPLGPGHGRPGKLTLSRGGPSTCR